MAHLDAEPVHRSEKLLRGAHPALQPGFADQFGGLHQRAHPVAQQYPVHRKMNVGLQAGGVQKVALQIQGLL